MLNFYELPIFADPAGTALHASGTTPVPDDDDAGVRSWNGESIVSMDIEPTSTQPPAIQPRLTLAQFTGVAHLIPNVSPKASHQAGPLNGAGTGGAGMAGDAFVEPNTSDFYASWSWGGGPPPRRETTTTMSFVNDAAP